MFIYCTASVDFKSLKIMQAYKLNLHAHMGNQTLNSSVIIEQLFGNFTGKGQLFRKNWQLLSNI